MPLVEIGIDPVLLQLGPVAVRWSGLSLVAAVLTGLWLAWRARDAADLDEDGLLSLCLWGGVCAVVGARLLHVVDRIDFYSLHPVSIAAIQEGGLSADGALLGATLAGLLYARRRQLDFWRLADLAAPSLAIGLAIVSVGSTVTGDAWGAPTDGGWGWVYTNPAALVPRPLLGVPTQPAPLYDLLLALGLFASLRALAPLRLPPGCPFLLFVALYSAGRFLIAFARADPSVAFGLRLVQLLALATLLVALPLLRRRLRTSAQKA